ncbi:hypothetical protein [Pseudomonas nitroreducens]|uniref:hypothetical protein n=1 Tax=Pseudomonas nitroreducens TaxID=46680 RepID=UPI001FB79EF9|nr:hypothetical protein [Pseudomonas nitroreducens]MCJ1881972.1 hypothetical protein [Pseudomonas nitroreducens]MCJ1895477.1 hypothetical protein [Pseudomonas nitroreducens]
MSEHQSTPDICTIRAFAEMCGVNIEEAEEWVRNGTIPCTTMGEMQVVNMVRFRAELLSGKENFEAGDYSND